MSEHGAAEGAEAEAPQEQTQEQPQEQSQEQSQEGPEEQAQEQAQEQAEEKPQEKPQGKPQGKAQQKSGKEEAKSPSGKSAKSSPRKASGKSAGSGKRSNRSDRSPSKKSPSKKKGAHTPATEVSQAEPAPDGCVPIFLPEPTQKIIGIDAGGEEEEPESPFKLILKQVILDDIQNRAAISEFKDHLKVINEIQTEDILLKADPDWKYGANFLMVVSDEVRAEMLASLEAEEEKEEETVILGYVPPEPRDWIPQGSEREINEALVHSSRPQFRLTLQRKRLEFGASVQFADRDAASSGSKTVKNPFVDVPSVEDARSASDIQIVEKEQEAQVAPENASQCAQTFWGNPKNAFTQYEARQLSQEAREQELQKPELKETGERTLPLFEESLQQNEIMNCFYDDYANLGGEGILFSKADNTFKEFQTFTDLEYSREKAVSHVAFHPSLKGIVAISTREKYDFDGMVEHSSKIILNKSVIVVWSFADPIQPQLYLEAPEDVLCFEFCPSDPNIIVGGCINGQIVLWDLSEQAERLRNTKGKTRPKKISNMLTEFVKTDPIPTIRYAAASSIELSHQAPVTDIQWVPDHFEIQKVTGYALEAKEFKNVQIMSSGLDETIYVWDLRTAKSNAPPVKREEERCPMGVPDTFWHLHLKWKPFLTINLHRAEPGGNHNPVKFSIKEMQGDRSVLAKEDAESKDQAATNRGEFTLPGAPKPTKQRMLQKVSTYLYVGTEDGEITYVDWMPQKDQDTGKSTTPKPVFYSVMHDAPIKFMARSQFDRTLMLCVGGWIWSLWKEGVNSGPILYSQNAPKPLTGGCWSPTRPSVFFITRADGSVEVWDLLDKTHEPVLVQNISANALTCCFVWNVSAKRQLLMVGDTQGTTHVHQVPYTLRTPMAGEPADIDGYYRREIERRAFVMARWDFREHEKIEMEAKAKREAGIGPPVELSEEEKLLKMQKKYEAYLKDEESFLWELGLKEEDEPLPDVD